ncbi:MAG: hypothetical protein IKJ82_04605 [Oscillospiraceae bacterium]|nr:hypothetical protein [Oscillospiraceae bacterium]
MFGYIKPYRPELRIREDEEYRAVYCGLCKELGRSFGLFARMTLSYDFAFMAMFLSALDEEICPSYEKCSCIAHPFKKRCRCCENGAISLSAKAAMVLTYYKLKDDIADKGFGKKIAAALLLPFASSARKKAVSDENGKYIDEAAKKMMKEQKKLESENCDISDMAAQPTAKFLEKLISLGAKEENERILQRFGYLLGRYIYLCDALDDLEDDRRKGNYNPFVFCGEEGTENAKAVLFMTVAELSDDLELLELKRYNEIIENTVRLGLKFEVERIINKKGGEKNGKSL